jgi:hypothetical protein
VLPPLDNCYPIISSIPTVAIVSGGKPPPRKIQAAFTKGIAVSADFIGVSFIFLFHIISCFYVILK